MSFLKFGKLNRGMPKIIKNKLVVLCSFAFVLVAASTLVHLGIINFQAYSKQAMPSSKNQARLTIKNPQKESSIQEEHTTSPNKSVQKPKSSKSSTTYAPYDPRNVGPLAPSPDKPPIPKVQKPLIFTPSSVTIYKRADGSTTYDPNTEATIEISNVDGKVMYFPGTLSNSNIFLTATSFTTRPVWEMTASSEYATAGTTVDLRVGAVAADGSAYYVGYLHITVLPSSAEITNQ